MQAQMQTVAAPSNAIRGGTTILIWLTGLHLAVNAMWYSALTFVDSEDFGASQWIGTTLFFVLGLIALGAMWGNLRFGRWMMIVVTAINMFLVLPEVLFLEGILRAGSIVASVLLTTTMILLFRPEIRKRS